MIYNWSDQLPKIIINDESCHIELQFQSNLEHTTREYRSRTKKPISKEKRKLMVSNLVAMAMKFKKRMLQILTLNYASQSRCLKSEQNFF